MTQITTYANALSVTIGDKSPGRMTDVVDATMKQHHFHAYVVTLIVQDDRMVIRFDQEAGRMIFFGYDINAAPGVNQLRLFVTFQDMFPEFGSNLRAKDILFGTTGFDGSVMRYAKADYLDRNRKSIWDIDGELARKQQVIAILTSQLAPELQCWLTQLHDPMLPYMALRR